MTTSLHQILCRSCGGHLVAPVARVHDPGAPAFRWDAREVRLGDTVPVGSYARSRRRPFGIEWTPDRRARRHAGPALPEVTLLVNLDDLDRDAQVVPGTPVACCGYDGSTGPNLACSRCGTLVGYAVDDCATPREARLLPDAVELHECAERRRGTGLAAPRERWLQAS